ncbi:MAG: sulfotransferase, partial [Erythrobacter sp.]
MPLGKAPPRLHPLDRSNRVDTLNRWLESAWSRGLSNYPSLEADVLREKAGGVAETSARSAEDTKDFDERLDALCAALSEEAQLNSLGRTIAHGQLSRVINLRSDLGTLWGKRPELLETQLAPPIIVVGQMRSGTTRIHRLLAADPAHSATRFCDSWAPVPPRAKNKPDLRPLWSSMALAMARAVNPWLDTVHPFGAARADEELGWLAGALDHATYEAQWRIPTFSRWSEVRDAAPLAREFARILRSDASHAGNTHLPRVMKCPQFSEILPELIEQFPDARLVIASRDDDAVLHSCISLVANQMAVQSDTADLGWIENEWRRKLVLRNDRLNAALADFTGPVTHLPFAELNAD